MDKEKEYYQKVKEYLLDINCVINMEDEDERLFVVSKEEEGIFNLVIDCEGSLLVMEQYLFEVKHESTELYRSLLVKNRDIIHGAFALDGNKVLFRDTLQLANLDKNELEGSLNSLSLLMSEYGSELIAFSKN